MVFASSNNASKRQRPFRHQAEDYLTLDQKLDAAARLDGEQVN